MLHMYLMNISFVTLAQIKTRLCATFAHCQLSLVVFMSVCKNGADTNCCSTESESVCFYCRQTTQFVTTQMKFNGFFRFHLAGLNGWEAIVCMYLTNVSFLILVQINTKQARINTKQTRSFSTLVFYNVILNYKYLQY